VARPRTRAPAPGRGVEEYRLALARSLRRAGVAHEASVVAADGWLLAALAYELLGLGGASPALTAAGQGMLGPMVELLRQVTQLTGLPLGLPTGLDAAPSRLPSESVLPAFERWHGVEDPFSALSQLLRARSVDAEEAQLRLGKSAAQKDEGAFYTPYKLARRLAERTLGSFDSVPTVLDPACGAGAFLSAAFDLLFAELEKRRKADPSSGIESVAWTIAALHGVELDPTALLAAQLSLAVRAVKAERHMGRAGQLSLFGQAPTFGPLILDRLRLGDALAEGPRDSLPGTERLSRRLTARDEPGRLARRHQPGAVRWDAEFPLLFSDEEGAFQPDGGFDVIVANPPYVPVDRIGAEQRDALVRALPRLQKRFDLFIAFVDRACDLVAAGGRATLLIPRTFLTEANAERVRAMLLDSLQVTRIEDLGPVAFDGARVPCIALTITRRRPTEGTQVELVRLGLKESVQVPQIVFRRFPRSMLRLEVADPAAAECLELFEKSVPLGRWFCASWGARGVPVSDFHLDAPSHPLARPMIKGDDLAPCRHRASSRWLLYDVERLYRPSLPEFFESPKLVVKKVTGQAGLVMAVDEAGHYTDDSLACVVRKADLSHLPMAKRRRHRLSIAPHQIEPSRHYDLHFLAGLLQSPLVQTYYRVQLGGGLNVFPELIEALPVPRPETLERPEAGELAALGRAAAATGAFDAVRADRLARVLFGMPAA
jgi:hypothetical protein